MQRRRFIRSTLGIGLIALPGNEIFDGEEAKMLSAQSMKLRGASDIYNIISRGDITRIHFPVAGKDPWIPLYQGNGRFGSCFGPWGLHAEPGKQFDYPLYGSTLFTHMKHFVRGKFNADYLLPLGNMYWETEPQSVNDYHQSQSFHDGTVTTMFATADYSVTITSWFDAVNKDVAGFDIDVKGNCPAIIVTPSRTLKVIYDQHLSPAIEEKLDKDLWTAEIKCLNVHSTLQVRSNARMQQVKEGLKMSLQPGKNQVLVGINSDLQLSADQSLHHTKAWWNTLWQNSGWLDLPDDGAQKVWVRSLAYTLYSHNDDGLGCSPPTGLAGNGWPFPFPFDSACRQPLLLWTGQTDAARKWIECWHAHFDGLKDYTRRLYNCDGIFMPHVFPYGSAFEYHYPSVPNKYYYPVYNSALMVRLVDHTAIMVNDPQWTKTYAEPMIREAAKFYLSHLKKGDDGFWHLHIIPSISLDESGDVDQPDYISGLTSAQYSLQKAIEYGLDDDHRMQEILREGLAFRELIAENGMYHNHLAKEVKDFGKQKHPDQLFSLTHTPLGPHPDEPTRKAQQLRYETTEGAKESRFMGHTLGEFILSSARMHDVEGWRKDWSMMFPHRYIDPDLIQFYESTGNSLIFYVTTHGLFAQALLETIVSTWWKELDLGACIPWKGTVRFGNIRTLLGVSVSGEIVDGSGKATLKAWKDTSFLYQGKTISLKKGQEKTVRIP